MPSRHVIEFGLGKGKAISRPENLIFLLPMYYIWFNMPKGNLKIFLGWCLFFGAIAFALYAYTLEH
jgi:hypothetical protein